MASVQVECFVLDGEDTVSATFSSETTVEQVKRWICTESPVLFSANHSDLILGLSKVNVLYDEGAVLISSHPTIQEAYLSGEVVHVVLVQRDGASATVAAVPPPAPTVNAALVSFENHAVVEGWLTKLGRNVQSWKRRWCVLQNNFIVYFKNKTDLTSPLGAVPIQDCIRCQLCDHPKSRNMFKIHTRSRVYFMYPDDLKETHGWTAAINRCMNALGIVPEEQNVAISNADKEGTLYKKGPNSSTGWNKRYFRLQDRILYYYKSEKALKPKGSIALQDAVIIEEDGEEKEGRKCRFHVQTRHRIFHLAAESPEARDQWIVRIREEINAHPVTIRPSASLLLQEKKKFDLDVDPSIWEDQFEKKLPSNMKEVVAEMVAQKRPILDRVATVIQGVKGGSVDGDEVQQFKHDIVRIVQLQSMGRHDPKNLEAETTNAPLDTEGYPPQFPVYFMLSQHDVKKMTLSVSGDLSVRDLLGLLLRKLVANGQLPEEEGSPHDYMLKLANTADYVSNSNTTLFELKYVREALKRGKNIHFALVLRNKADVGRFKIGSQRSSRRQLATAMGARSFVSQERLALPFQVKIGGVRQADSSWCGGGSELVVECFLAFGAEKLGTIMRSRRRTDTRFNDILVSLVHLNCLPRETRLCCTIWSKTGTREEALGFANVQIYDHFGILRHGKMRIPLWTGEAATPCGTTELTPDENAPQLTIELPAFPVSVLHSLEKTARTEAGLPDSSLPEELRDVIQPVIAADPLMWLKASEKKPVWEARAYLQKHEPQSLPKVLLSADWLDPRQVKEVHALLAQWPTVEVSQALELLDLNFADTQVRKFALKCLDKHDHTHNLNAFMLQLLQAVKFEAYHSNDLTHFLLRRAFRDKRDTGQRFFWQVKSEHDINPKSPRFRLMLQAFMLSSGLHVEPLLAEASLVQSLHAIANKVKRAKPAKRLELLHEELDTLQDHMPLKMALPLNPRYQVCGFIVEECKWLDSFTVPLWLVFRNAYGGGEHIAAIFKVGDDLRQDVLTLQMFKIMDDLWKQEGLDLHLTPYQCMSTGFEMGMIEVVPNAQTTASIHKLAGGATQAFALKPIAKWLADNNPLEAHRRRAEENFIRSVAAYCVGTYVLGIGDRHNDNIMITTDGHLFHIDFAHFLGNTMKFYGIKRERARFVLTPDFVNVMGGRDSDGWRRFLDYCGTAYNILRKNAHIFMSLFMLMLTSGIPQLTKRDDLEYLHESFALHLSDGEARETFKEYAIESLNTKTTQINNFIHILAHAG